MAPPFYMAKIKGLVSSNYFDSILFQIVLQEYFGKGPTFTVTELGQVEIDVLHLVSSRTAFSVIYRRARLWNKLVPSTKEVHISQFKSELRVGLLGKYTFETD